MRKAYREYTPDEVERLRKLGFVCEGVVFDENYYNPKGVSIILIKEKGMTLEDLKPAAQWLRVQRDLAQAITYGTVTQPRQLEFTDEIVRQRYEKRQKRI